MVNDLQTSIRSTTHCMHTQAVARLQILNKPFRQRMQFFATYGKSLPKEREGWLLRAADLFESKSSDFVDILVDEVGSPLLKAQREVETSIGILRSASFCLIPR